MALTDADRLQCVAVALMRQNVVVSTKISSGGAPEGATVIPKPTYKVGFPPDTWPFNESRETLQPQDFFGANNGAYSYSIT